MNIKAERMHEVEAPIAGQTLKEVAGLLKRGEARSSLGVAVEDETGQPSAVDSVFVVVHRPLSGRSAGPLAVVATDEDATEAIAQLDDTGGFPADDLDVEEWGIGEIQKPDEGGE